MATPETDALLNAPIISERQMVARVESLIDLSHRLENERNALASALKELLASEISYAEGEGLYCVEDHATEASVKRVRAVLAGLDKK